MKCQQSSEEVSFLKIRFVMKHLMELSNSIVSLT